MVSNSYCTTFQMNHTPCWAFCESIPVEHICCEKKFLQYHSAVTLTMRNWECWQDKAKKWLDPPLFRQTHPSTSHNRTGEKILKLWHTQCGMFSTFPWTHISQIAMLYHSVIWIIIYPLGGRTKKKQHFGVQFPLKSLTVYFCIFLVKMFCRVLFSYIQNIQEKPFT